MAIVLPFAEARGSPLRRPVLTTPPLAHLLSGSPSVICSPGNGQNRSAGNVFFVAIAGGCPEIHTAGLPGPPRPRLPSWQARQRWLRHPVLAGPITGPVGMIDKPGAAPSPTSRRSRALRGGPAIMPSRTLRGSGRIRDAPTGSGKRTAPWRRAPLGPSTWTTVGPSIRTVWVGGSRSLTHEAGGLAVDQRYGHPISSIHRRAPDRVHL